MHKISYKPEFLHVLPEGTRIITPRHLRSGLKSGLNLRQVVYLKLARKVKKIAERKQKNVPPKMPYDDSVQEVLGKMKAKEREARAKSKEAQDKRNSTEILQTSINRWLYNYKRSKLKSRSFDRLEITVKNQILKYPVSYKKLTSIDSDMAQGYINEQIDMRRFHMSLASETA